LSLTIDPAVAFISFDSPVHAKYARRFPADRAMTDLV
jgi:hypothetical protein